MDGEGPAAPARQVLDRVAMQPDAVAVGLAPGAGVADPELDPGLGLMQDRLARKTGRSPRPGRRSCTRWPRAPRPAMPATTAAIASTGDRKSLTRIASSKRRDRRPRRQVVVEAGAVGGDRLGDLLGDLARGVRAHQAEEADALAGVDEDVGERHARARARARPSAPGRGSRRSPSRPSGRSTARRSAPPPIRARGRRAGRRGRSGASRCAAPPRR